MNKAEDYIKENTKSLKESNGKEYFMWISPDQALRAVEIAREEIYKWLRKNHEEYQYKAPYNYFDIEQCIDDLKQAMNYE